MLYYTRWSGKLSERCEIFPGDKFLFWLAPDLSLFLLLPHMPFLGKFWFLGVHCFNSQKLQGRDTMTPFRISSLLLRW